MNKILICYPSIPFIKGGGEKLIQGLQRELVKRKINVETVQIPFKWYPVSRLLSEVMIWRLLDLSEVNGERISMVISTKFPSTVVKHHHKKIWLIHQHRYLYDFFGTEYGEFDNSPEHDELRKILVDFDTQTLLEAKEIYTISKNVSGRLLKFNNITSSCLYTPIDQPDSYYTEGYGDYILFVGRLKPIKRAHLMVEACKYFRSDAKCLIIGTGCENDNLKQMIEKYQLTDKIQLLGYVDDEKIKYYYANAFAIFNAPFDEDYGYVTQEAFLSKKPVITTNDSGGVLEFVKNGENGYVCRPDPEEIGSQIDMLFMNKKRCRELGEAGYTIANKISWDFVLERLLE